MQRFLILVALCAASGPASAEVRSHKNSNALMAPEMASEELAMSEVSASPANATAALEWRGLARDSLGALGAPLPTGLVMVLKRAFEQAPPAEIDGQKKGATTGERKKAKARDSESEKDIVGEQVYKMIPEWVLKATFLADDPKQGVEDFVLWLFLTLVMLSWTLLVAVAGYFYHTQPPKGGIPSSPVPGQPETFNDWKYGVFDCFSAPESCFVSFCCPAVRWSHTVHLMGFCGFWLAFTIFMGLDFLGGKTAESLVWVVLALVCAGYRQEMRRKYGFEKVGGMSFVMDFLLYFWCACCAITQEARQADEAQMVGHPVIIRMGHKETAAPADAAATNA